MKISKNIISIIFIAALLIVSCDNWLEDKPEDGLILQDYWKTEAQVTDAVVGCYSSMTENENFVWYLFLWGELRSDLIIPSTKAETWLTTNINGIYTPSDPITNWGMLYKTINQCNTVLKFGKNALETDNAFTPEKLASLEAEALSIRALMYFYLARVFGDVPLVIDASVSDDQDYFVGKSPQSAILAQVLTDLQTAEKSIPFTYGKNDYDKGRITKYAVWAMLADVNLWMENFQDCSNYCDSIINAHKFGLITGNESWFSTLYYTGNSNEGIFELQFNEYNDNLTVYNNFAQGTLQKLKASENIYYYYFPTDEDNPDLEDIRGNNGAINPSNMAIWKYVGGPQKFAQRGTGDARANWIFYRYADVLLMKAEALNEMQLGREAFKYIDQVRIRANAYNIKTTAYVSTDTTNVEDIAKYILDERTREFAFEGKRWFDLLRYTKRNNYGIGSRKNQMIQIVTRNIPPAIITNITNRYKDNDSHYLPINYYEIERNFKLEQREFYKTTK